MKLLAQITQALETAIKYAKIAHVAKDVLEFAKDRINQEFSKKD